LLLLLLAGLGRMNWLSVVPQMAAQPFVAYTLVNCCGPLGSPCQVQSGVNSAAAAAAAAAALRVRNEPAHGENAALLLQQQQQLGKRALWQRHLVAMLS
jgi:hypothetical protein